MGKKNWFKILQLMVFCSLLILSCGCKKESSKPETGVKTEQKKEQEQTTQAPKQVSLPEFTAEQIWKFQVNVEGETKYCLNYFPREDRESFLYWDMEQPYSSTATVDTEEMYKVFQTIAGIDWTKAEKAQKAEDTGLASSKTSISIEYVKEEKIENSTEPRNRATLLIGRDNGKNKYYCAFEGAEDKVFLVDTYLLDAALNEKPYNMILKIPYILDIRTVKEVDISLKNKLLHMEQKKGTYRINGKKVEKEEYQDFYSKLLQPGITGEYTGEEPGAEAELSITYRRTSSGFENYTVTIYPYDDQNEIIKVNGKTFFLVSKEEVTALKKSLLAYNAK